MCCLNLDSGCRIPVAFLADKRDWANKFKSFTCLVEDALAEFFRASPDRQEVEHFLNRDGLDDAEAQRVSSYLQRGLESESFLLPTELSEEFSEEQRFRDFDSDQELAGC